MNFCRVVGTEPYMVVNAGFGDEYSAAAEVEYFNGSTDTLWASSVPKTAILSLIM